MRNVLTYLQQEEFCVALLVFKEDLSAEQLEEIVKIAFGTTLTRTAIGRARTRFGLQTRDRLAQSEKGQWVHAFVSTYPDCTTAGVMMRCRQVFGEVLRSDLVDELRRLPVLSEKDAQAILSRAPTSCRLHTHQPSLLAEEEEG